MEAGTVALLRRMTPERLKQAIDALGSAGVGGGVQAPVYASTTAFVDCTTAIPSDDTIPQNTEGTEVLTATITPLSTSNRLVITAVVTGAAIGGHDNCLALFKDSDADAIACTGLEGHGGNFLTTWIVRWYLDVPSTSSQTYKLRVGSNTSLFRVNGATGSGVRHWGGVAATTLSVEEVAK